MNRRFLLKIAGGSASNNYGELYIINNFYESNLIKDTNIANNYFFVSTTPQAATFDGMPCKKLQFGLRDNKGNIIKNTTTIAPDGFTDLFTIPNTVDVGLEGSSLGDDFFQNGKIKITSVLDTQLNAVYLYNNPEFYIPTGENISYNDLESVISIIFTQDAFTDIIVDGVYVFSKCPLLIPDGESFSTISTCISPYYSNTKYYLNEGNDSVMPIFVEITHGFDEAFQKIIAINDAFCIVNHDGNECPMPFDLNIQFDSNNTLKDLFKEQTAPILYSTQTGERAELSDGYFAYYTPSYLQVSSNATVGIYIDNDNKKAGIAILSDLQPNLDPNSLLNRVRIVITSAGEGKVYWFSSTTKELQGQGIESEIKSGEAGNFFMSLFPELPYAVTIRLSEYQSQELYTIVTQSNDINVYIIDVDSTESPTELNTVTTIEGTKNQEADDDDGNTWFFYEGSNIHHTMY